MANTKSTKHLSFAYSYGFTEGKVHSRKLTALLKKAGYTLSDNPASADIIIAHSAGCWYKLDQLDPRLIIYVGMPLPTKRAGSIWLQANKMSFKALLKQGKFFRLLKSICFNAGYMLRHPLRNLDIIRKAEHALPVSFNNALTVFVMNRYDPWPQSNRLTKLIGSEPWSFVSLSGMHNNLWHEPEKYVKLINHYARILAKTDR